MIRRWGIIITEQVFRTKSLWGAFPVLLVQSAWFLSTPISKWRHVQLSKFSQDPCLISCFLEINHPKFAACYSLAESLLWHKYISSVDCWSMDRGAFSDGSEAQSKNGEAILSPQPRWSRRMSQNTPSKSRGLNQNWFMWWTTWQHSFFQCGSSSFRTAQSVLYWAVESSQSNSTLSFFSLT